MQSDAVMLAGRAERAEERRQAQEGRRAWPHLPGQHRRHAVGDAEDPREPAGRRSLAAAESVREVGPATTCRTRSPERPFAPARPTTTAASRCSTATRWTCCRRRSSPRPTSTIRSCGRTRRRADRIIRRRGNDGHTAGRGTPTAPAPAIVEVLGVSKRFGMSQALERRLDARSGRRFARAGRPQRRRQVDAGRRADRHPRPGHRPRALRRAGRAGTGRPRRNGATASPASTRSRRWCRR